LISKALPLQHLIKVRGGEAVNLTVANILSSPSPPNPLLLLNASFVMSKAELYLLLANSITSKLGPNSFVKNAKLTALNVISRHESGCGQKAWR
jgi:hypothetical protein